MWFFLVVFFHQFNIHFNVFNFGVCIWKSIKSLILFAYKFNKLITIMMHNVTDVLVQIICHCYYIIVCVQHHKQPKYIKEKTKKSDARIHLHRQTTRLHNLCADEWFFCSMCHILYKYACCNSTINSIIQPHMRNKTVWQCQLYIINITSNYIHVKCQSKTILGIRRQASFIVWNSNRKCNRNSKNVMNSKKATTITEVAAEKRKKKNK